MTPATSDRANGQCTSTNDDTIRVGMLLDVAHSHQELIESSLLRLEAHTRGLDAVVRDEIRHTLISECNALEEEISKACMALHRMQRVVNFRAASWSAALIAVVAGALMIVVEHALPTASELSALRSQREQLARQVTQLSDAGGRIELRRCGREARLCVRVDTSAPSYGSGGDYLVVKGY